MSRAPPPPCMGEAISVSSMKPTCRHYTQMAHARWQGTGFLQVASPERKQFPFPLVTLIYRPGANSTAPKGQLPWHLKNSQRMPACPASAIPPGMVVASDPAHGTMKVSSKRSRAFGLAVNVLISHTGISVVSPPLDYS